MRIFQILSSMRRAGAESAVATLCTALAACGAESHLVVLGGRFEYDEQLRGSDVKVHLLRLFQGEVPFYDLRTRRAIRAGVSAFFAEVQPEIVHFHLQHALTFSAHALRNSGAAAFYTFHSLDPIFTGGGCRNHLRKQAFRRAVRLGNVRLLAVSPSAARHCAAGMGLPADAIRVQPNPIDLGPWRELAVSTDDAQAPDKVAMVGTLYPLKRVDVGVEAIRQLAARGQPFHLVVIGAGPQLEDLRASVSAMGLTDRVRFLGNRLDVPQQLRECGALWLLSEREGMPMAALEAMALGVPVIASDVPGTNDLVRDGANGLLVPFGDAQAVADRTVELWGNPHLRAALVAEGARTVDACDATHVARQHLEFYRKGLRKDEVYEA
ncbi:MAG TPA: glycosyltransferase family 4 protein [Ramlibacter sp.]|jgi:glycosyltransferase involved in cell wall biosynthesis|nr:glycosyltransferase family 4 protein [Ramlibacter sp.]